MDKTRCPDCGERVMPFAAGCSICGSDLDLNRFDSGPAIVIALIAGYFLLQYL